MTTYAFFDLDGTLTSQDSFFRFLVEAVGWPRLAIGAVRRLPWLLGYGAGLLSNDPAKRAIFREFFAGWPADRLLQAGRDFSCTVLPGMIRPAGRQRLAWHCAQGHVVAIVSASFEFYLEAWCQAEGVHLIGTRCEIRDGRVTGEFLSPNCHGPEKVVRIRERFDLREDDYIYAYGDSRGDREMLDLADEAFFQPFR
ncbi:MAG: Phosphoserine phosphatase [Candidatus Ozemobacter sibiricus]|jgi:HAD superfamily hydrolase (TIGR01490 family)|uniref:Phosphoserine phosphatase n=1 Tax=Candidatus Ozemobacter sibiricus TaxID=2268124 RepID=A0A367ZTH4_9BACT|nr:MAG: Phosphoserine phosphatase [Candidatus Ozemobacter sibiricus]